MASPPPPPAEPLHIAAEGRVDAPAKEVPEAAPTPPRAPTPTTAPSSAPTTAAPAAPTTPPTAPTAGGAPPPRPSQPPSDAASGRSREGTATPTTTATATATASIQVPVAIPSAHEVHQQLSGAGMAPMPRMVAPGGPWTGPMAAPMHWMAALQGVPQVAMPAGMANNPAQILDHLRRMQQLAGASSMLGANPGAQQAGLPPGMAPHLPPGMHLQAAAASSAQSQHWTAWPGAAVAGALLPGAQPPRANPLVRAPDIRPSEIKKLQKLKKEPGRYAQSRLYKDLEIGTKVTLQAEAKVCQRRPELVNAPGFIAEMPVYPTTWVGIRLEHSNELVKVRSTNFVLRDQPKGTCPQVYTDRLKKSLIFNRLRVGKKIKITKHRKGFEGAEAEIIETPKYPSTWMTVKVVDGAGKEVLLKVRTSQVLLPDVSEEQAADPPQKETEAGDERSKTFDIALQRARDQEERDRLRNMAGAPPLKKRRRRPDPTRAEEEDEDEDGGSDGTGEYRPTRAYRQQLKVAKKRRGKRKASGQPAGLHHSGAGLGPIAITGATADVDSDSGESEHLGPSVRTDGGGGGGGSGGNGAAHFAPLWAATPPGHRDAKRRRIVSPAQGGSPRPELAAAKVSRLDCPAPKPAAAEPAVADVVIVPPPKKRLQRADKNASPAVTRPGFARKRRTPPGRERPTTTATTPSTAATAATAAKAHGTVAAVASTSASARTPLSTTRVGNVDGETAATITFYRPLPDEPPPAVAANTTVTTTSAAREGDASVGIDSDTVIIMTTQPRRSPAVQKRDPDGERGVAAMPPSQPAPPAAVQPPGC